VGFGYASTTYDSVASSQVLMAGFAHSPGPLSRNSSVKIQQLTISWCSILWTVHTNALVDHAGLPLQVVINWLRSSLCTPTYDYIVSSCPSTTIWIHSHPVAFCFWFLLLLVLRTIFISESQIIGRWLHWQPCGGLNCVCSVAASQQVAHWIKHPLFGSICIRSQLAEVSVEPWFADVE